MKNLKWLRSVVFILILCLSVQGVLHCYTQPKDFNSRIINTLEDMPDNTVDGVVVGTSVVAHGWVSAVSWEKYGMATYQLGTSTQPFAAIPGLIEYALKHHDLKYVVIDIHALRHQTIPYGLSAAKVKAAYLNVPDLEIRYRMLSDLLDYADRINDFYGDSVFELNKAVAEEEMVDRNDISLYIPLNNFHNRWVDGLKKADYVDVRNEYLGANDRTTAFEITDMTSKVKNLDFEGLVEIDDFQKGELDRLFAYLEETGLEVLFISTPSFKSRRIQQDLSSVLQYCADNGYDTIDFGSREMLDTVGFDTATDFADNGHLNLMGAQKITTYICDYLIENGYYCADKRGQAGYEIWDEGTKNYKEYFKKGWAKQGIKVSG